MRELPSSLVNVMATAKVPSIGLSYRVKWIFPIGAALSVAGVVVNALWDQSSINWSFRVLSKSISPLLMMGSAFLIIGAFLDRQRLSARQARLRGVLCWVVSAACFTLLKSFDSVPGWSFALIFPAFAGLIAGIILLP